MLWSYDISASLAAISISSVASEIYGLPCVVVLGGKVLSVVIFSARIIGRISVAICVSSNICMPETSVACLEMDALP